jgi:hypothetical protein
VAPQPSVALARCLRGWRATGDATFMLPILISVDDSIQSQECALEHFSAALGTADSACRFSVAVSTAFHSLVISRGLRLSCRCACKTSSTPSRTDMICQRSKECRVFERLGRTCGSAGLVLEKRWARSQCLYRYVNASSRPLDAYGVVDGGVAELNRAAGLIESAVKQTRRTRVSRFERVVKLRACK